MMKWIIGIMALSLILFAASLVLDTRNMTVSSSEPTEQEQAIEQIGTAQGERDQRYMLRRALADERDE